MLAKYTANPTFGYCKIAELYRIEADIKGQSAEARLAVRREQSAPCPVGAVAGTVVLATVGRGKWREKNK